ncbi:MAG: VOC family protein [Burkholderiaceae bacterium]
MIKAKSASAIGTIDHVVIAVSALAQAKGIYERLGFTLSPKGVHSAEMGTENRTIMLRDDYVELLAVTAPTERNADWRQVLEQGGGLASMALRTEDAAAAREQWIADGLEPAQAIQFSRPVRRADGSTLEARFEIVWLPVQPDMGLGVFVCQQFTREAVWLPELQVHANTAVAVSRVVLACPDAERSADQWQRALPGARVRPTTAGFMVDTGRHTLNLVQQNVQEVRALGIDFAVTDLRACSSALVEGEIAYRDEGARLTVRPEFACNVAIGFEEQI